MCGIYGVAARQAGYRPDPAWLDRMGAATRHRGPDDAGTYASPGVALGMRRLAIIDVQGGHQPLASADGAIQVVCNGEIYNFRELRAELQSKGYRFSTGSDCEVLVHLYAEHGIGLAERLDGMFGFAIWDEPRQRLVLGRDRVGVKPLYYLLDERRLVFASEAKAILEVPGVRAELDMDSVNGLLALGYVSCPRTMFRGIRRLPAGSLLICDAGRITERRFWRYTARSSGGPTDPAEAQAALEHALDTSVASQMVADVPLGAFLSGGLDSSAVVALMARHSPIPVKTYSIGFDTGPESAYYNELPYARRVAEFFGTEHHEILVRPDVVRLLPRLIWHMDEPVADSALITTYLVAEFARRDVTVILSGVGGDELFGGYRRYLGPYYSRLFRRIPAALRQQLIVPLARSLPSDRHTRVRNLLRYARQFILNAELPPNEQYGNFLGLFSDEQRRQLAPADRYGPVDVLTEAFARVAPGDLVNGFMQVDIETQLPDDLLFLTDKMTMAASLECRVPLLSNALLDLSASLPSDLKVHGRELKYLLRRSVAGMLPPEVLNRPKRGFGAPMGAWLKRELRGLVRVLCGRESVEARGLFSADSIARCVQLHESGREDFSDHLQCLVNLEIWCRLFLDRQSPDDIGAALGEQLAAAPGR